MQRAQVLSVEGGVRVPRDGGDGGGGVAASEVIARVGSGGSKVVGLRVVGVASVDCVRDRREGEEMRALGFLGGGCSESSGREMVVVVVVGVVEVLLVMRRGWGMRWRSVVVEVEVGWREGAERLWEMEGMRAMGRRFARRSAVGTMSD